MRRGESSDLLALAANQNVKERDFWLKQLSGEWEKNGFPYDKKISTGIPPQIDKVTFKFPHQLVLMFIKLSKDSLHTLHMVLTAGVALLLDKYTRATRKNTDIMIGSPVYMQNTSKELINTFLVLRNSLPGEISFKDLLMQVRQTIIEAVHHQNYPLETLAENFSDSSTGNGFPLFEVAVLLENIQERKYLDTLDLNMVFSFARNHEWIGGRLEYNALLYDKSTAGRVIRHLIHLFEIVFLKMDLPLSVIEVMPENERKQLLFDLNQTVTPYPRDKTLHRLFGEQVERTPGNTALVLADMHLSYRKLNEQAIQLAGILRARGVKLGKIVGLLMERSIEMIISILGILKAGGVYLPLEVNSPQERMVSMLEESKAGVLLTTQAAAAGCSFSTLQGLTKRRITPYRTALRPRITDLDSLPLPDHSLVDYSKYHRHTGAVMAKHVLPVFSSRGCPYQCAYCHKLWPKKQIVRSAENLFREVKIHYDMGIQRFSFLDDIFNLNVKNSSKFFQMVLKEGLDVQFYFSNGLRSDILTKEFIDLMIEAGTINFMMALESASPRIQKLIGKNLNIERFRENLQYILKKYPHLLLEVNIMMGFPSESEEEAMRSLEFIKDHQWIHFPNLNILKIYPNTDMEKLARGHGITLASIESSLNQAYHQLGETLPFSKNFVRQYQADLLNDYFLKKERLLAVLPYQIKAMSADELVQKYDSYLPADITSFSQMLDFFKITPAELGASEKDCVDDGCFAVPDFQQKVKHYWREKENGTFLAPVDSSPPLKVLLLELSKTFTLETSPLLYDVIESPFGLIQLLTYLNHAFKGKIQGKIAHSRVDFDNLGELKALVEDFKPDVIGIRTLTFYKDFFHQTIAAIRQWGIEVPIISGGPYATSDWEGIIQDRNIDLVVIGEGEITFAEIISKMIENNGKLPGEEVLKEIPGIAFCPSKEKALEKGTLAREIIMVDQLRDVLNSEPVIPLSGSGKNSTAAQLAYVVFTSGSTGKPKGVLTTHYNVTRVVRNTNYIDLTANDRVLQLSNYAFDGSVFDIYGALLNGAALVLISWESSSAVTQLAKIIKQEQVTVFFVTTALFNLMVDLEPGIFKQVKKVLFGGERISMDHACRALEHSGPGKLIHVYGPTETTVYASYYKIDHIRKNQETVPIGKPIANTTLYILDNDLKPVPIMVIGEIYIGGEGVARGYLNKPELTEEKFGQDLWDLQDYHDKEKKVTIQKYNKKLLRGGQGGGFLEKSPPGRRRQKIYRTGDLARWTPGGGVEFLGRADYQVKIRGFRIELEEIEKQLLLHRDIKEAVVVVKEGASSDQSYINAYIVTSAELEKHQLREFLLKELPDYMIPAYFIQMDEIPLTSNGKVDRERLSFLDPVRQDQYAAPGTNIEKIIAGIWEEVLGLDKVGIHDNFFEVGGNSLNIIRVNSRLKDEFERDLPLVSMFTYPTIHEYGRHLVEQEQEQGTGSTRVTNPVQDRSEVKERGRNNLQQIRRGKGN